MKCYSQDETAAVGGSYAFQHTVNFDYNTTGKEYMQKIDSVAHTQGISGYFGRMYSMSMKNIDLQIKDMDSGTGDFIKRFEASFADYFLDACESDKSESLAETSEWKCYFSSTDARPWQLVLLGVNTHINIDFWQALVITFSEKEIRQYKKQLLACQRAVNKSYDFIFDEMMAENGYLRFINSFTKGISKKFGEEVLYKWRRRTIDLAIMYYHDQKKFKKKLALIIEKKHKVDQMILRER